MNSSPRLVSLDAFRGATIASMLLVNNPGSWSHLYSPLEHAPWNGWTFTDTVFPFFLWIVGVSMSLSFARRLEQGADRAVLFRHVLIRAGIIFLIGLLLAAFPFGLWPGTHFSFGRLRIPGVLQRIAVCYAVASAIVLSTGTRGRVIWLIGLLLGYAAALHAIPVPGFGAGHLEPKGNLAWWIDSHLLAGHTWRGAPTPGFDPEGILSTLPAIGTTLLGVLTGEWLRRRTPSGGTVVRLLAAGAILAGLGLVFSRWDPINKNLWTASYVLFMGGLAAVVFGCWYALIDVRGWRGWALPFVIFGMNAIAMFALSGLVARLLGLISWHAANGDNVTLKGWLMQTLFTPFATPINASLLFAVAFVLVHFLIAWAMWRRRWFLKV